jgi:uncharacterized membrane protein YdbT with pleckstrin-like domain
MMIEHKFFETQQSDEQILLVIKRHYFELVPPMIVGFIVYFMLFLAVMLIPIYVPTLVTGPMYNLFILIISIFFLFNTTFLFNTWLLHYLHVAILTSEHFVEINQYNIFSRKISEMGLDKIQDVSASQRGIFATMFNFGNIDLETAGELPNFNLEYVGDPNAVSKKIMEVEEEYSKRHGIRGDGVSGNANMVNNQFTQAVTNNESPKSEETISSNDDNVVE